MDRLRLVFLSGDWIPVALPDQVRDTFPRAQVVSLGGATEAAIWSNYYPVGRVDPAWASIPYGRPIRNARYYVLDCHGQPAPVGVPAELYIAGDCVADGYLNRPELTAEKFLPDPFASVESGGSAPARMYRTGDLAKFWPDGTIEFLGRRDQQVKVRGFRIELGEVEATLARHPGVGQAVAAAVPDAAGEKQLIAYVVPRPGHAPTAGELRRFLQERLPDYLVPAHFVPLTALPLNANGKIDRRRLPGPDRGRREEGAVPPRDATEAALAAVWCEVLGLERVGVFDNFFELGGHSLKAAQVVSRVRQRLGRELPLAAFFRAPTVAAAVRALESGAGNGSVRTASPAAGTARSPAAPAQRQLWFLHQLGQGSDVYTIAYAIRLAGDTDSAALRAALTDLAERHAALRTTFADEGGSLEQVVHAPGPVDLPLTDLSDRPPAEREAETRRLADEFARAGFDLRRGPLWRARLVRLGERDHRLLLTLHHLITDGQSMLVLLHDLAELYAAAREGRPADLPPAPSFADYSRRLDAEFQGDHLQSLLAHWRERLTPLPPPLALPADRPQPPEPTFRGGESPLDLPPAAAAAVAALARQEGATPFAVLLAAFQALLQRTTGQDDFAVGVPVAGRGRAETEGLVGPVVNTLVLRADLAGEPTFRELVGRARRAAQEALAHQDLPFDVLVRELRPQRDAGHQPLFPVLFSYSPDAPPAEVPGATWAAEPVATGTAKFDLSLYLFDRAGGLHGHVEYAADLFDAATAVRLAGHFRTLLAAALERPDTPIGELPLLSDAERHRLLVEWNTTALDVPTACVPQQIEQQAARTPERVAIVHDGRPLSYRDLNQRANRLAHHLRALGVGPDVPVGLCVERSADLVIAALAVLKAGGAYLPLDPGFPADRLAFYVRDSKAPLIVTHGGLADRLPGHGAKLVRLDADAGTIARRPATDPAPLAAAGHLAYVLYTSGSTGTPKGVMVRHGGLTNLLASMRREPGFTADDRFLALTTLAFDIHTLELWLPLTLGAVTEVVGRDVAGDGRSLDRRIARSKPTVLQATPATWRLLLAAGWEGDRGITALCGGEAMTADLAGALLERVGALWNLYGPTETTVYATAHRVRSADGPAPIGRPIANTQAYVFDRHGQPVPVGVPGELHIGGAGVARGYIGRPDLTAEKFVPDPFAGRRTEDGGRNRSETPADSALRPPSSVLSMYRTGDLVRWRPDAVLEYLGRFDRQVKVRGFRIEPGEVEAALAKHPAVRQAVVVARRDGGGADSLAAFIVPQPGAAPAAEELRRTLRAELPEYMVPTHFAILSALPLTPTGKIDYAALPDAHAPAAGAGRAKVAPRNDVERDLAALWEEVLGVKPVGITDDFFDLGGHSYLAAVLMARVRERLGHTLPLGTLFAAPTVEALAAVLQRRLEAGSASCLVPLHEDGDRPPLFLIAGVGGHVFTFHKFARLLGPEQPAYGVKAIGVDGVQTPPDRVEAIAERYAAEISAVRPDGPVVLGGYSVGALIAYELALRFRAQGRPVGPLVVFDMTAPDYPRPLPVARRLLIHLGNFVRGPGRRAYLRDRLANVRGRLLDRVGLSAWNAPTIEGVEALPQDTLKRVWAALHTAQQHYRPRAVFDGPVLLFRAEQPPDWAATVFDDPLMGWARWSAGGVEAHTVPGGHLELFREANLAPLAATLRARLEALMPAVSAP